MQGNYWHNYRDFSGKDWRKVVRLVCSTENSSALSNASLPRLATLTAMRRFTRANEIRYDRDVAENQAENRIENRTHSQTSSAEVAQENIAVS